jgi:hypothetical protein
MRRRPPRPTFTQRLFAALLLILAAVLAGGSAATAATLDPGFGPSFGPPLAATGPNPAALDDRGKPAAGPYQDPPEPWSPSDYDGAALSADAADLTALPTIHAAYLYPSDAPSRFSQFAAMFQRDARRASDLLTSLYGRGLRWDERLGSDGTTRYLDITVVKSRYTSAQLGADTQFSLVGNEVSRVGLTKANKKYLVWLDAPSRLCGQSDGPTDRKRSARNAAEGRTVSAIYRYYDPADAQGGFCSPVLHELSHAMGAVSPWAPNFAGGGHCNDNANDTMCLFASAIPYDPAVGRYYDYGTDDYWDPAADPSIPAADPRYGKKLGWWTTNLSRFICPVSGCQNPSTPNY